jgi:hypothetical protein
VSPSPQISADAANGAYINRNAGQVGKESVQLDGRSYQVFGYASDPVTGFHATTYRNTSTNEIIIAYRGTDPDFKHHGLTGTQDLLVDATMVRVGSTRRKPMRVHSPKP